MISSANMVGGWKSNRTIPRFTYFTYFYHPSTFGKLYSLMKENFLGFRSMDVSQKSLFEVNTQQPSVMYAYSSFLYLFEKTFTEGFTVLKSKYLRFKEEFYGRILVNF